MSTVKTATYNVPRPAGLIKLAKSKDVLVTVANMRKIISVKKTGELAKHAFYLPKAFRWIMANDSKGNLCLIPRKRS
jgi:hypothetical protein